MGENAQRDQEAADSNELASNADTQPVARCLYGEGCEQEGGCDQCKGAVGPARNTVLNVLEALPGA